jgi:putative copper resistance protein D
MLDAALVFFRFLHFASCIFVFGASVFCIALLRAPGVQLRTEGLRPTLRFSALAAVVTALLWFQCVAGTITGNASGATDPDVLQTLLFSTSFGQIWLARVVFALALAIVAFRPAPEGRILTAALSGLLLASVALTGHAAMQTGIEGAAHRLTDAIHLASGGYWIGAVAALPFLLRPAQPPNLTYRVLCRFSNLGVVAVIIVIASGVLNALFIVQDWSRILYFAYGKILLVKVGLVVTMAIIASVNRFILTPTFREGNSSFWSLRRSVFAETLAGGLIVLAASLLGTVSPPVSSAM